MRQSEKIARLEQRINQLEKEAGLLDIFNPIKKHLVAVTKGVAKDLKRYKIINEAGTPTYEKDYKFHEVQMSVIGSGGIPVRLKVVFDEIHSSIQVILFRPRQQGYDRTVAYMHDFVPGDKDSTRAFVSTVRGGLTDRNNRNRILKAIQ